MPIKILLVVLILTLVLHRQLGHQRTGNPEQWTTENIPEADTADSTGTDSFFNTTIFAEKMQPTILLH